MFRWPVLLIAIFVSTSFIQAYDEQLCLSTFNRTSPLAFHTIFVIYTFVFVRFEPSECEYQVYDTQIRQFLSQTLPCHSVLGFREFSKIIGYESLNIRDNVEFVRLYGILNGPNDSIGYVDYAVEVFTYPRNTVVFNQKENFTTIDTAGFDFVGSIRLQTGKRVAILKEETESINSLNSSQIWNYFDYVLFCQSDSIQTVLTSDLSVVILDSDNRAHLITSRDIDQYFRSLDSRVANWSHLILQIKQVEPVSTFFCNHRGLGPNLDPNRNAQGIEFVERTLLYYLDGFLVFFASLLIFALFIGVFALAIKSQEEGKRLAFGPELVIIPREAIEEECCLCAPLPCGKRTVIID